MLGNLSKTYKRIFSKENINTFFRGRLYSCPWETASQTFHPRATCARMRTCRVSTTSFQHVQPCALREVSLSGLSNAHPAIQSVAGLGEGSQISLPAAACGADVVGRPGSADREGTRIPAQCATHRDLAPSSVQSPATGPRLLGCGNAPRLRAECGVVQCGIV